MKRLLIFLVLTAAGGALLLWLAGGLAGPQSDRPEPVVDTTEAKRETVGHTIDPGRNLPEIREAEGVSQRAPPRTIVWRDRLSDESLDLHGFSPWLFRAATLEGLPPADAEHQGALCRQVELLVFREPASRAEALALQRSEPDAYAPLLQQRFEADEARVFGRLGQRLQSSTAAGSDQDETTIRLTDNVRIVDMGQGFDIRCDDVTVWVEQDRAVGRGDLVLRHEAFTLTGHGLEMERVKEKNWNRVEILRKPVLRIDADMKRKDGRPVFDFGSGDFQPARIFSEGRAILIREERRRETVIRITFSDRMHAEQVGGRRLDAGRAELTAARREVGSGSGGWKLRHFLAENQVSIEYPDTTARGQSYLTSATAERLVHDVPEIGTPQTVLEGDPVILMRGEIPVVGPDGRLRASARDRAWIGPAPAALRAAHPEEAGLQHIALRGQARIERSEGDGLLRQDVLEGDEIDLVVRPRPRADGSRPEDEQSSMEAIYFAALGSVRLDGPRIQGSTHRLVGDDLHTETPHIVAEGRASRFAFPNLGRREGLVGPGAASDPEEDRRASAGEAAPAAGPRAEPGAAPPAGPKGEWVLNRLHAKGLVDIDTRLDGPALGIPAHLTGEELTYDRVSRRAQVVGRGGAPARIAWESVPRHPNVIETPLLTLDRARGQVVAKGGVHAELHVTRQGSTSGPFDVGPRESRRSMGGATLSLRTDSRIDIDLVRSGGRNRPKVGAEQLIRIHGPVTTELQSAQRVLDRLRSQSLEIGLVYLLRPAQPAAPTAPASRAGAPAPAQTPTTRPERPIAPIEVQRYELDATEMRADLEAGEVRRFQAHGAVEMRGEGLRVSGDRLTWDASTQNARVFASQPDWTRRPAAAWLGDSEQRTEITARELSMDWVAGATGNVEAVAPAGSTAEVQLYRQDRTRPGQLEWYALTYANTLTMSNAHLRSGRMRLVRRVRAPATRAWGPPTVLWSPSLHVTGQSLLSSKEAERDIRRIVAEGPDTTFQSGEGNDLVEVWGHRFDLDVPGKQATLTGTTGQDVTFRQGGNLHSEQIEIVIDLKTNLPAYVRGNRILWNPRRQGR